MFVPETEDMLPRTAPKPSAPAPLAHCDGIVRPTVPEVSILFGAPPQEQQKIPQERRSDPVQRAPTFASWKKQMLPRVNFSPVLVTELGPRAASGTTHGGHSAPVASKEYVIVPRDRRCDEDRGPCASTLTAMTAATGTVYAEAKNQFREERRAANSSNSDVLTICAGTQTDPMNPVPQQKSLPSVVYSDIDISHLATKDDVATLVSLLESLRQEQQQQLRSFCEAFGHQRQPTKDTRAMGSQCDILTTNDAKRASPIMQDYIIEEAETVPNPVRQARVVPHFHSPRNTPPMAQSTGYRANTPQAKRTPQLSKPNTEKSVVMNELAMKYLRQPVDALMMEMRLGPSHRQLDTEPLRQIDNLTHPQSPNDISNASYKYLKKYRLLPEEVDYEVDGHVGPKSPLAATSSPQMQLDLENLRNQPKLL
ncbi:hypothetical protein KR018_008536 [Drosophila ironensis]|nr:hypothetical protein KR018_008536 [Drosophila ironensis]